MVNLLLSNPRVIVGSILLYVVVTGNEVIAERVITVLKSRGELNTELWVKGYENDDFTDDVTPLILAAQRDKFGVMKLLLQAGFTIERPHPAACFCEICRSVT